MFAIVVIALLIAAGLFYWAATNVDHGVYWADRVCRDVQMLCAHPWWLLAGAIVIVAVGLARQMIKG
jgi:hypothetical protein